MQSSTCKPTHSGLVADRKCIKNTIVLQKCHKQCLQIGYDIRHAETIKQVHI